MGVFIKNLPKNLSIPLQEQYDWYYPIFKRYAKSESTNYYGSVGLSFDASCLFLEMAIFYKTILLPLSLGSKAFTSFGNTEFNNVRIGNYVLTQRDRRQIRDMEQDFHTLLEKSGIPAQLLLFSDVKDFARNLNRYYEEYQ